MNIDPAVRRRNQERTKHMIDPEIRRLNEEVAKRINLQTRADPSSPYTGKTIGLVNGEVVVVSESLREVVRRLDELDPENRGSFVFEASRDYDEVGRV